MDIFSQKTLFFHLNSQAFTNNKCINKNSIANFIYIIKNLNNNNKKAVQESSTSTIDYRLQYLDVGRSFWCLECTFLHSLVWIAMQMQDRSAGLKAMTSPSNMKQPAAGGRAATLGLRL